MLKIKLIMLDIDGCLLEKGILPTMAQINFFHKYGSHVLKRKVPPLVFCTGRGAEYVGPLAQVLGIMSKDELPSVVESGSFLYYPLTRKMIPHPALTGKEKLIMKVKGILFEKLVGKNKGFFVPGKEVCISLLPPLGKTTLDFTPIVKKAIPKRLSEQLLVTYSTTAVDVTINSVDKGSALNFYSQVTGISAESILAIGDGENDLPILEKAGAVACPANATGAVKKLVRLRGGFIADKEGTNGVMEIIQHYVY